MPDARRCPGAATATNAVAALLVVLAVSGVGASPAMAQTATPVDLGAYGGEIRLIGDPGTVFELSDGRRYADTLELRSQPGGDLQLINELSMEQYVEGLREVPAGWPEETLKAQAVAARTYAWYQYGLGTFQRRGLGYDICATVACQVFTGREVVETPGVGARWAAAVAGTAGQVLISGGEPILARFFSTSGGRTQDNEEVFPSEGPRPYLVGVPDPDDAVSPFHVWQVRFTRDELDAILSRGESLGPATPLADIRRVPVDDAEDRIVVTGLDGTEASVTASAFRFFVSREAVALFPDRFPSDRADGTAPLPAALPSSRMDFAVTDDAVVVDGRGWGHGVGMSQYGALGQGQRGVAYDDILAHYYNGLRPMTPQALPARVRVGLSVVDEVSVRADAPFRVVAGGQEITARGLGTWTIRDRGDRSIGLGAPAGYGAPLIVSATETGRLRPSTVEVIALETVVNKPSELRFEALDADGATVRTRELGVVDPGRHRVTWSLDAEDGSAVPPGVYAIRLAARDEEGTSAGEAVAVEVVGLDLTGPAAQSLLPGLPDAGAEPGLPGSAPLAALAGAAVGGLAGTAMRRRSVA